MNNLKFDRFYEELITIFDLQLDRLFLEARRRTEEICREYLDREISQMAAMNAENLIDSFYDPQRNIPPDAYDLLIAAHLLKQYGDIERIYSNPDFHNVFYLALVLILEAVRLYPDLDFRRTSIIVDELEIHTESHLLTPEYMKLLDYLHHKSDYHR
jgi:hypothetical protein